MKTLQKVLLAALCLCFCSVHAPAQPQTHYRCTFERGAWNSNDWLLVKSPRWDHAGTWIQKNDHIENAIPADATAKELLTSRAPETYTSMVLREKVKGSRLEIRSTLAFEDRMAPLLVMAAGLDKDAQGRPQHGEHWEVILWDGGITVWHHIPTGKQPWWHKAAFVRKPFEKGRRYALAVKIHRTGNGPLLTVSVDGQEILGYTEDALPRTFYVGITGCEGVNRFYDFSVSTGGKKR